MPSTKFSAAQSVVCGEVFHDLRFPRVTPKAFYSLSPSAAMRSKHKPTIGDGLLFLFFRHAVLDMQVFACI